MDRIGWRVLAALLLVGAGHASARAAAPVRQDLIDAVKAGRLDTARATWWGFDAGDATRALQQAIDSGAPHVVVEDMGTPWVVTPILLASNQEVLLDRGVVIEARRGAFKGEGDCLFTARLAENVVLRGYGATFRMHKADYQGPEYRKAEWRHALQLLSCRNVQVLGLTMAESGGDGIYLGVGQRGVPCSNVLIKDVVCDANHRQGISVISAENVLLEDCVLRGTSGTAPMAGIDFEPNEPDERIVDCTMRRCVLQDNAGDGIALYLSPLKGSSTPVSVRFEDCRVTGNRQGLVLSTGNAPEDAVAGTAEVVGCTFAANRGTALVLDSAPASRWYMRFAHCTMDDAGAEGSPAPIVLRAGHEATEPVGSVTFDSCAVRGAAGPRPLVYQDWAGGLPVVDVAGTLLVERAGQAAVVPLTAHVLDGWLPSRRLQPIAAWNDSGVTYEPLSRPAEALCPAGQAKQRDSVRLLLYARAGDRVALVLRSLQVGHYPGRALPVTIVSPSGGRAAVGEVPFQQEATLTYAATQTGVHQVLYEPGANAATVVRTSHCLCLTNGRRPVSLYETTGDLFFWVPGATRQFGVKVMGDADGEAVRAALYDGTDHLCGAQDDIVPPHQFVVDREPTPAGQVWRLSLERPTHGAMEDFRVQLQGVPPLLAPARDLLLVPSTQ